MKGGGINRPQLPYLPLHRYCSRKLFEHLVPSPLVVTGMGVARVQSAHTSQRGVCVLVAGSLVAQRSALLASAHALRIARGALPR
jgi:hypothetical protein